MHVAEQVVFGVNSFPTHPFHAYCVLIATHLHAILDSIPFRLANDWRVIANGKTGGSNPARQNTAWNPCCYLSP